MRVVKIVALALVLSLALAGAASASVRDGVVHAAGHAATVLGLDDGAVTPAAGAAPSPESEPAEADDAGVPEADDTHGAAVSAVAQSDQTATWTNPAGKEITNHGKAVSAVAKSDVGKPAKAQKAGDRGKSDK